MKRLLAAALLVMWCLCAGAIEKSTTIVYINGAKFYIHAVQKGETLYALSKEYGVTEQAIVQHNPSVSGGLRAGESVKIPFMDADARKADDKPSNRKLAKTFDFHIIKQGETLYGISRRYEIPIQTIIADNPGLDPTSLRPDSRILIRKKAIGSQDEADSHEQWEQYRQSLNSVADEGYGYHIVRAGETFYSLARRYGISEQQLSAINGGLQPSALKAGAMIKVPTGMGSSAAGTGTPPRSAQTDSLLLEEPFDGTGTTTIGAPARDSTAAVRPVTLHALDPRTPLNIALMLPLSVDGQTNTNYLEFYQGFLLGLDSVKLRYGISANLGLYNTGRNPETVGRIIESHEFSKTNLIVGPVYEEELSPVIRYGEQRFVPVVTPLATIAKVNSDVLFQLAPDPARKWDKVKELLGGEKHITLIYTESTDKVFEQEILALLNGRNYSRHDYQYAHHSRKNSSDMTPLLDNARDNLFIVMADNETDVDRVLAALSSANTGITARGRVVPRFAVLGNARWNRYTNIDRTLFFRNRVIFISSYHAKRDSQVIRDFDSAYIRAFGAMPSLYSYRGYDAAMIFCVAMYGPIVSDIEGVVYTPLQTPYEFGSGADHGTHVNQTWVRVSYNSDFSISVE